MKNLMNTCYHLGIGLLIQFGCYTAINENSIPERDSAFTYTKHMENSAEDASMIWLGCHSDHKKTAPIIGNSDGDQTINIPLSPNHSAQFHLPDGFSLSKSRILPAAKGETILCAEIRESTNNELFIFRTDKDGYHLWNLALGLKAPVNLLASISSDQSQAYLIYQSSIASVPYIGVIEIDDEGATKFSKVIFTKDEMSFSDISICLNSNKLEATLHSENETLILDYSLINSDVKYRSNLDNEKYQLSEKKMDLRERSVILK